MTLDASSLPSFAKTRDGLLTVAGASPELLLELLRFHTRQVSERGFDLEELMNPGLTPDEVRETFGRAGLQPPDELVTYFGWHNGLNERGWKALPLPCLRPIHLGRVVSNWEEHRSLLDLDPARPFALLDEDFYGHAVVLNQSTEPPEVMWWDDGNPIDGERVLPRMRSICTWVLSWITALELDYYYVEKIEEGTAWNVHPEKWAAFKASGAQR